MASVKQAWTKKYGEVEGLRLWEERKKKSAITEQNLIKKYGTMDEFKKSLRKSCDDLMITEVEYLISLKRYEEELKNADQLDKNIISIQELRRRKEEENKSKIIKRLLS